MPRRIRLSVAVWCGILAVMLAGGAQALGPGRAGGFPVANDARLGGDENRTRFVVDLSQKVDITAFTLADPYRVIVDLPQIAFELPPKTGAAGRGLVKAFRFGLVMQGGSRIVLDLAAPVRVDKAVVLDAADGQPARLVLDLVAIDRDSFLRNLSLEHHTRRVPETASRNDRELAAKPGDSRPLIVLDPGHGGLDSGTVAPNGEPEKTIVLEFARQLRDKLEKTGKYRVLMTRNDDHFIPLDERVRYARNRQAALLISIHADALAHHDQGARGASIYTLSETASDAEAARLADEENRADALAGVDLSAETGDVADILIDLAQRETKTFSTHFAHTLLGELKAAIQLHKYPLKSAGFRVLKAPDVPSVLIELGYVSNSDDFKLMTSQVWRTRATESITQAVQTYFATRITGNDPGRGAN